VNDFKTPYDLLIIGAGPAGLAAAHAAKQASLSYLVIEKGMIAQTVYDYPIGKPLHSGPETVELAWGALHPTNYHPTREEVLLHYTRFAIREQRLHIRALEQVQTLARSEPLGFKVETDRGRYQARNVILATGGFGIPRRLGVPGESDARVTYRFSEGFPFAGQEVLVVGGGNSAAEAARYLHEAEAKVTLSLRRASLAPVDPMQDLYTVVKEWNRRHLEALHARGEVNIVYSSQLVDISHAEATLRMDGREGHRRIRCQRIFALIGADPDLTLLRQVGAEIAEDGRPVYDAATHQTTVPGLYVAGHLSRELHLLNAILVPPTIVRLIAAGGANERGFVLDLMGKYLHAVRTESRFGKKLIKKFHPLRRIGQAIVSDQVRARGGP